MLFENREAVIDVSEPWREARDVFHQGRSREAWVLSLRNRGRGRLTCANDYLLQVEIACVRCVREVACIGDNGAPAVPG